jgi:lipopolysaccharide export system protein LptA
MPLNLEHRRPPLVLRRTILVLLILFLTFLAGNLTLNLRRKDRQAAETGPLKHQALTFHEEFQALEFSGQKRKISLKAENFFVGNDRNQHLEGGVEIVDEELAEGLFLRAGRVQINPENRILTAEGWVELKTGSVQIEASSFEYNLQSKLVKAGEAKVIWRNLGLRGEKLVYEASQEEGVLEGGVEVQSLKSGREFSLRARKIGFKKNNNSLDAEELVLITGPLWMRSQTGGVLFEKGNNDFDLIRLEGKAEVHWKSPEKEAGLDEIRLNSESLVLLADDNSFTLSGQNEFALEGSGQEWQLRSKGESLRLIFTAGLEARIISSRKMSLEFSGKEIEDFNLYGQQTEYDLTSGLLQLDGQAYGSFKDYELRAGQLKFNLNDRSFTARNFQLVIMPGFFEVRPLFFVKDSSWFLSGDYIEGESEFFDLQGKLRISQADSLWLAEKARFEQKTGNLLLEKLGRASWLYKEVDDQVKKIELGAEKASFVPGEKRATLEGSAEFSQSGLRLKAREMWMYFKEPSDRLFSLEASGRVSFFWKDYQACGQQLSFNFEEQKLVMTGGPELWTLEGSRLETDKLTLFLEDDKILLESQKRERSLTILVRQK